ncbi:MAG TPA: hypothetical protein VED59_09315 [Acidimicrobiales bacterium]|nr:hypothetical protein [Acidimicrobiales bacterium]
MVAILVSKGTSGGFTVKVNDERVETSHVVNVPQGFAATLGLGEVPDEELVRASFAFLLEREPPTSVLPRFSLDVISRYFPEYPREVGKYIGPDVKDGRSGNL